MSSNNKPTGFTPGPRHKVFGISDDLLKTTRAILIGEKPEVEETDEETGEKQEQLSEKSITVSMHSSGTKYKVHSVHKSIAGQIKPGEHLSDTHIDDLKDSGIKVNHVKPKPTPKTAKPAVMGYRKEALKVAEHKGDKPHKHPHPPVENEALGHNCANHVKSEQWGDGQCIPGMHTLQETGDVSNVTTGGHGVGEKSKITAHINKKYGGRGGPGGSDPIHVGSHGGSHAHNIEAEDHESTNNHYAIHHEKTGKTHEIKLAPKKVHHDDVHKQISKHGGSVQLAKHISVDHNSMYESVYIVTHYDVMFEHGIEENVPVEDLEIVSEKHHSHGKWKKMKEDDDNGNGKSKKKSKKSKKLDKVDPDELEGSHDERDDEDIDNDDDVDASDKYLHKRRKAIHKAIKKEDTDRDPSGKRFNPAAARTRPKPSTTGRDPSGKRFNPAAAKRPSEKKVLDILALNRKHY